MTRQQREELISAAIEVNKVFGLDPGINILLPHETIQQKLHEVSLLSGKYDLDTLTNGTWNVLMELKERAEMEEEELRWKVEAKQRKLTGSSRTPLKKMRFVGKLERRRGLLRMKRTISPNRDQNKV